MLPALLFVMPSCDNRVAWTDTVTLDPEGWSPRHPAVFDIDPQAYDSDWNSDRFAEMTSRAVGDTVARLHGYFDATLSLRYSDDCNAGAISLVAERASLDSEISTDTLTFTLFDRCGNPSGRGRFGINEVSIRLPYRLKVSEGTVFSVYPLDYDSLPAGFLSATLILRR